MFYTVLTLMDEDFIQSCALASFPRDTTKEVKGGLVTSLGPDAMESSPGSSLFTLTAYA